MVSCHLTGFLIVQQDVMVLGLVPAPSTHHKWASGNGGSDRIPLLR